MTTTQSVAEQILKQTTQGAYKSHSIKHFLVATDDIMKRITEFQARGYITNAKMTSQPGSPDASMVVEFTMDGVYAIILRELESEAMDTEFLEAQIAEYSDQIPKGFLEGLKAAEGILRGKDFLENYIETK